MLGVPSPVGLDESKASLREEAEGFGVVVHGSTVGRGSDRRSRLRPIPSIPLPHRARRGASSADSLRDTGLYRRTGLAQSSGCLRDGFPGIAPICPCTPVPMPGRIHSTPRLRVPHAATPGLSPVLVDQVQSQER
jgi:hypothetical protein